jgi:hypothetical protein
VRVLERSREVLFADFCIGKMEMNWLGCMLVQWKIKWKCDSPMHDEVLVSCDLALEWNHDSYEVEGEITSGREKWGEFEFFVLINSLKNNSALILAHKFINFPNIIKLTPQLIYKIRQGSN